MKKAFFLMCMVFCAFSLHAQIAAEMDSILAADSISFGQAARFVLSAAEIIPENAGEADAFREAQARGWIDSGVQSGDAINLGFFSLLCMKAFDIPGGFMYSLFPVKRYAYREMVYRNFIHGRNSPSDSVSGNRLILILGRILSYTGGDE